MKEKKCNCSEECTCGCDEDCKCDENCTCGCHDKKKEKQD